MNNNYKRKVAVFDFDGTLTTRDTLLLFLPFALGRWRYICAFMLFLPLMLLMKLKLYDNSRLKEQLMTWCFKGWTHEQFKETGMRFQPKLAKVIRQDTNEALARLKRDGATVYVISASISEWIKPYCERIGADAVLCTEMEVNENGLLTGHFATPNCYGAEKVRRLLAVEPDRENYILVSYGDSDGDAEMFAMSDEHHKV